MSNNFLTSMDARKFVFFSPATKGSSGRPVKIKASLLPQFISLVDPKSHEGQLIIHRIQRLSATAAQTGSYQNSNSAFARMELIKHIQIFYKVLQLDDNGPVGVYITDIRPAYDSDGKKAGLYNITKIGANFSAKEMEGTAISGSNASINGACATIASAADSALQLGNSNQTVLFYNPSHVVNELGIWDNCSQRANNAELASSALAKVLIKNQDRGSVLNWHIEGEGTALLIQALAKVTGELSNQRFRFVDPVGDTTASINLLKGKKAQLNPEVVAYTGKRAATIAWLRQRNKLASAITSLVAPGHPLYQEREKSIAKLMSNSSVNAAKFSSAMNAANGGQTTFTDVLKQVQGLV